ncbi:MAG TPA: hypothetical protein H9867_06805, partial [Candidatus Corynebacterium gallistercoris]|nr:hypothetical protein [Candidatus Corynebacterium gallistercoris]
FMDWRCSLGAADDGAPPSFCYIQPLGDGRWLWEETILSTHAPADPDRHAEFYRVLERRLHHRRNQDPTAYGCDQVQGSETVAIPMGTRKGTLPHHFGAAGGAINPATGYSLGASLSDADMLLDELGRPSGVRGCVRRANRALAYLLRQLGGELIAQASHETCLSFFDAFFALPARHQLAYLTGHNGVAVAATMWALRKNTGFAHPFLMPLWKKPLTVAAAVRRRMRNS